ncbi:MAG: hypothetical protein PHG21_15110 [Azoarcus sp.]|nr:hypothetical protein [Azoarcus sp.]MDD2874949.1 hypothetical protein [Azoarcus sp.]
MALTIALHHLGIPDDKLAIRKPGAEAWREQARIRSSLCLEKSRTTRQTVPLQISKRHMIEAR